jgi:3-oxoacyl-[acyl-carrier-protein] synthase-3
MRIAAMSSFIPDLRIDTQSIVQAAGGRAIDARVFHKLFGLESVSALPADMSIQQAFIKLVSEMTFPSDEHAIDTLIYVHAFPIQHADGVDFSWQLCRSHPALSQVERCYEVDQHNCGSAFWGLSLAQSLLTAGIAKRVMILIGDSFAGFPLEQRYIPGCTIMGDAFVGMVIDEMSGGCQIENLYLQHRPEFHGGLFGDVQQNRDFFEAHNGMVMKALQSLGFESDNDCPVVLPHNINTLSWLNFSRSFPKTGACLNLGLLPQIGHCCATDPFLLLQEYYDRQEPPREEIALLSIGSGAYIGACHVHFSGQDETRQPSRPLSHGHPLQ